MTPETNTMNRSAIDRAAGLLFEARRSGIALAALEPDCRPATIEQAHAIQDALVLRTDEAVKGWKVAGLEPGKVTRGAIIGSRFWKSPARIKASDMSLLGIEGEIAFRLDEGLPPRDQPYSMDEVIPVVTALPAIEIVDSRFQSYRGTDVLDRLCDCMSNGGLICGEPRPDWREFDLSRISVRLLADGERITEGEGGHANGDPLLPLLALANLLRTGPGLGARQVVTTGTFTGLTFAKPGQTIRVEFAGFGHVEVVLEA